MHVGQIQKQLEELGHDTFKLRGTDTEIIWAWRFLWVYSRKDVDQLGWPLVFAHHGVESLPGLPHIPGCKLFLHFVLLVDFGQLLSKLI